MRLIKPFAAVAVTLVWLGALQQGWAQKAQESDRPQGRVVATVLSTRRFSTDGPPTLRRFAVLRGKTYGVGKLREDVGRTVLERPGDDSLSLPLQLDMLVSRDGRVVLQYGDTLMKMHPLRTDLFWIDEEGAIAHDVRNRYDGAALLDMSSDGYAAVAGRDYFRAHAEDSENVRQGLPPKGDEHLRAPWHIDLYRPDGERLWEVDLGGGRAVTLVRALPGGRGLLARTADPADPLRNHELLLWRDAEKLVAIEHDFRIVQAVVVLGDGERCFVQGIDGHGVIDLRRGRVLWKRSEPLRMVGPDAAALDARGRLLVMTGQPASAPGKYLWTMRVLAGETGAPVGEVRLDEPLPGSAMPVFARVEGEEVTVLAPDRELLIRVSDR